MREDGRMEWHERNGNNEAQKPKMAGENLNALMRVCKKRDVRV